MTAPRMISLANARRLAVTKQRLSGPRPPADREGIMDVVRSIGCLQLDPTSAVARNHLLVLWSRLGPYDPADLDAVIYDERKMFEFWAHAASLVLTEDYPIHEHMMQQNREGGGNWTRSLNTWAESNPELRDHVLKLLEERGPTQSKDMGGTARNSWTSSGWTNERNVGRMLDVLWIRGRVMVSGRKGGQRLWDLAEHVLPDWTPHEELSDYQASYRAAQRSLKMLGVGTAKHISQNYVRWRYPDLNKVMKQLEKEDLIVPVQVGDDSPLPGAWYLHRDDIPALESIEAGDWQPRTTLLSPFDNLIADRARTEALFNYRFRIEIYVPKHLREYGYYVLSILYGDRLIGRIDPTYNRKAKRLEINAVFAEPGAPLDDATGEQIQASIAELATFLGAKEVVYGEQVPEGWRGALVG